MEGNERGWRRSRGSRLMATTKSFQAKCGPFPDWDERHLTVPALKHLFQRDESRPLAVKVPKYIRKQQVNDLLHSPLSRSRNNNNLSTSFFIILSRARRQFTRTFFTASWREISQVPADIFPFHISSCRRRRRRRREKLLGAIKNNKATENNRVRWGKKRRQFWWKSLRGNFFCLSQWHFLQVQITAKVLCKSPAARVMDMSI